MQSLGDLHRYVANCKKNRTDRFNLKDQMLISSLPTPPLFSLVNPEKDFRRSSQLCCIYGRHSSYLQINRLSTHFCPVPCCYHPVSSPQYQTCPNAYFHIERAVVGMVGYSNHTSHSRAAVPPDRPGSDNKRCSLCQCSSQP